MRFRLTVTQLRIVILVANLLLSGGVLAYASYSYFVVRPNEDKDSFKFVDIKEFPWSDSQARITTRSSALELQSTPELLQPKKPPEVDTTKEPEAKTPASTTTTAPQPGDLAPGPLAEKGWKFVTFIIWPDDPLENQAILRKESDVTGGLLGGRPGSTGRTVRTRTVIRPQGPPRGGQPGVKSTVKNLERVAVTVRDRIFTVDDGGQTLAFLVDAVDSKRFVYSEYSKPSVSYALPYELPGEYLGKPEEGLQPPPPPPAAAAEGGAPPEKKESIIQILPDGFTDRKEEEYAAMKKGGKPGPVFETIGPKGTTGASPTSAGGPPIAPRAPTEDEKKQLRDVLRSSKIKPEDRQKLQEALRGVPR